MIAYIDKCYKYEEEQLLKDVYVTDHVRVEKRLISNNEEEDQDFFDYEQSVDEYNNDSSS